MHPVSGATIDHLWLQAESLIPTAVEALRRYRRTVGLDLGLFYLGLVPLVAQLMVRHPEFEKIYAARNLACAREHGHEPLPTTPETVNLARNVDYLCLCGLLVDRAWCVVQSPSQPLIGSDLGLTGARVVDIDGDGYVIPLHPNLAVFVYAGTPPRIDGPAVFLEHEIITADEARWTNAAIAGWAPSTVFGRDERTVRQAVTVWDDMDGPCPLREEVPHALTIKEGGLLPRHAERFLRDLHKVQSTLQPTLERGSFDTCVNCHWQLSTINELFDNYDRAHAAANE